MKGFAHRWSAMAAAAALLLGLGACGGGGGDSTWTPTPTPSTVGVTSVGTISGFGSVYVNGVRYDTACVAVTMDDQPATVEQLRIGQYVEVKGHMHDYPSVSDASAEVIRYHNVLEGPVASIDLAGGSFVAMGQTVLVSLETVFGDGIDPAALDGLAVGDVVEVSGLVPVDGIVHATRIDVLPDGGPYDVSGYVTAVAAAEHRFDVNALAVDYSSANIEDFPSGAPAVGDLVLVKGFTFLADGTFVATRVELRSDDFLGAGPGDVVEVEGEVAGFVSITDFAVADRQVTTTPTTVYEHGTAADLADGVQVKVVGLSTTAGVVVAHKIAFREVSDVRLVGQLEAIGPGGALTLLGVPATTDEATTYQDMSTLALREFGLDDLAVGDWLDLRGYETPAGSGQVIATRVVRIDPATGVRVRGPFRDPARPNFDVLTVLVATTDATKFVRDGVKLTPDTFYTLATGELVEAWGTWNASVLTAERVEIKVGE